MTRKILVADLLCGAGGSSTGCARALAELGLEMELVCLNHWQTAIDTHTINHPKARHYCQDISTVRPHIVVPEGYLDLLMASPSCTHHSVARGGKPTSDQQRSDPWHIITWFTELRVKRAIIENVWEFTKWGPVDHRDGKPIKSREGEYFRAWVDTIWKCGATSIEWRKLNAADYGDATTRQRFIMFIRFDGKSLSWPMPTHAKRSDGRLELFPSIKPWRPAREIINWGIKGRSIFNRKKHLAIKTLRRIYAGAVKHKWPEPFLERLRKHMEVVEGTRPAPSAPYIREMEVAGLVQPGTPEWEASKIGEPAIVTLRNNMDAQTIEGPIPTVAANGTHIGLAQPMLMKQNFRRDTQSVDDPVPTIMTQARIGIAEPTVVNMKGQSTASSVDEPLPTQTAHAAHLYTAEPIIVSPRHGKEGAGPNPRPVSEPLPTITAGGSQVAVAEPVIMNGRKGNRAKGVSIEPVPTLDTKGGVWLAEPLVLSQHTSGAPRSPQDPLPTITTGGAGAEERQGCARPMLVEPFILNRHGEGYGDARAHSTEEPAPTASTSGAGYLVEPFVATVAHGNDAGDAKADERRVHSAEDPLGTIHAGGGKFAVVEPFMLSQASGGAPRATTEPVPAIPTDGAHALITPYYGSGSGKTCSSAEDPLPTATVKPRFGMVMPVTHSDTSNRARDAEVDPLPTLTTANRGELAFIAAQFGEREGQSPRVHDVDQPTPTICAGGRVNLVEASPEYDILFRMLEPEELAAAMGFSDGDAIYEFAGTKTEKVKQIGNAVSVKKMQACVYSMMADAVKPARASRPAKTEVRGAA